MTDEILSDEQANDTMAEALDSEGYGARVVAVGRMLASHRALRARVEKLEKALMSVRTRSLFEMEHPTGLEATCLSLIFKESTEALGQ